MKELTGRQQSVLEYIARHAREKGYPPTIREIRDAFHLKSNRGVVDHLRALERKGFIRRAPGSSRAIELLRAADRAERKDSGRPGVVSYPVAGNVAAGRPEPPVEEADQRFLLDERLFGGGGDFLLEVKGDSMIEDHIAPGDLLVVRRTETCESGALVVALVDGEATVKRYLRSGGRVILRPANPKYEPIVFSGAEGHECSIIGTVVGVIRAYL